jgi:hypothetical protein
VFVSARRIIGARFGASRARIAKPRAVRTRRAGGTHDHTASRLGFFKLNVPDMEPALAFWRGRSASR